MKKITTSLLGAALASVSLISYADGASPAMTVSEKPEAAPTNNLLDNDFGRLSGVFDFTSNYVFRGISQDNNTPAAQGGLTYSFKKPGIYLSAWGSNVNLIDPQGSQAVVELDTVIGITNPIGENFTYDISLARYNYPKASGLNYNELLTVGTYRFLKGTIGYSPNVYNLHRTGTYYEGAVILPIPSKYIYFEGIGVQGAIGYYSLPKSVGLNSYQNYSLQINKTIANYIFAIQWTGTDGRAKQAPLDRDQVIFTVTANF